VNDFDSLTRDELVAVILELRSALETLKEGMSALDEENERLRAENEELRTRLGGPKGGGKQTPVWVKANRPERRKRGRKNRGKWFGRLRETPTEVVEHALERCPDCGRKLSGGTVHHSRQVIEIPETPVSVIEHRVIARYCGVCGKTHMPRLDLSGEVIGKSRMGVRLMSLVSYLHIECRMPKERTQGYLAAAYKLHLGLGEISEILHRVARCGKAEYEELLEAVRGSPAVNADETGWREDGKNGYVWSFSTPEVRYFVRDASRSHKIPERVLGEEYGGVVVSDFYSAYGLLLGRHQRCWVHMIRDLDELAEANRDKRGVGIWAGKVKAVYRRAKAFSSEDAKERQKQRLAFEGELMRLARPYVKRDVPQRVLAERIVSFLPEMLMFVECADVPSDNNAAERAIRPVVTARKVSGGTRSSKGSDTRMTLTSLFATWRLRGEDSMECCRRMLTATSSFPSPAPA